MIPYLAILVPTCVVLVACRNAALSVQRRSAMIAVLIITLFAAVRGYTGTDTYSYHMMFIDYRERGYWDAIQNVEPLFVVLIKIISLFSDSSFAFSALISIFQGAVLISIIKRSARPADLIAIYVSTFYILFQFNTLRAGVAILLLLLAYHVYDENDKTPFALLCLLAIFSHYSAFIGVVLLVFMVKMELRQRIATVFVFFLLGGGLLLFIIRVGQIEKIMLYIVISMEGKNTPFGVGFLISLLMYVVIYATSVGNSKKATFSFLFFSWLILRIGSNYFNFIDRFEVMFNAIFIVSALSAHAPAGENKIRGMAIVGLVSLGLYGTLNQLSKADVLVGFDEQSNYGKSPYLPYRFFWDN